MQDGPVCLDGRRPAVAALGVVAESRHPARADRARQAAADGRLERCHLTLEEAVTPPAENLVEQRRVIDEWRHDDNDVRPREALGDVPPALAYRRSPRRRSDRRGSPLPPPVIGSLDEGKMERGILMRRKPQPAEV